MDANQRILALIVALCLIVGYLIVSFVFGKKRSRCLFCERPLEAIRTKERLDLL